MFTGDEISRSCSTGQGHLIIKISQNIGHVHILRLIVKIKDDNESNSFELVDDWLTDFMLLLKGDEISRSCGTGQSPGHIQIQFFPVTKILYTMILQL